MFALYGIIWENSHMEEYNKKKQALFILEQSLLFYT